MKLIVITILTCLFFGSVHSQSFIYHVTVHGNQKTVEITLDTNYSSYGIFVEKRYVPTSHVTTNFDDLNALHLIGDFVFDEDGVLLDYANNNYFWIPFDPAIPFYSFNKMVPVETTTGYLIFSEENTPEGRSAGDWIYWCFCSTGTSSPGGCVSQIGSDNRVRCVPDEPENCPNGCVGQVATSGKNLGSGGFLVQASKAKSVLVHRFNTR